MDMINALKESKLSQYIAHSISHEEEHVRVSATQKTLNNIQELIDAGITKPMIFYIISISLSTIYVMGGLSLLKDKDKIEMYLEKIYPDAEYRSNVVRQLMIHMHIVKENSTATPELSNYIQTGRTVVEDQGLVFQYPNAD